MAPVLKQKQTTTAAQKVVARLDAFTQEQHLANLEAARDRTEARRARARAAAARLRSA